jgi:2-desacetyl-2-hydroxyethyl bacteriochlorophyllide A dehydrogenase
VAVHAVAQAHVAQGSTVLIMGAGPIGLLLALVVRHAGAAPILIGEPSAPRREAATELGFELLDVADPVADLVERTGGARADVVFDAAAVPAVARILPQLVRPGGTVALVGVYEGPTPVDLQSLVFREVTMRGNRVYTPADIHRALELLLPGSGIDAGRLVTATVPVTGTQDALAQLGRGVGVKYLVDLEGLA